MKRILLLLLLIPISVNASEYTPFQECEGYDNLNNTKSEIRYKYYKTYNVLGPYELEINENVEYPLIDRNDYIYSDYSEWTFSVEDKEFESKEVYKYKTVEDTNEIFLGDFSNPDYYVDISSINVFYENKKIPYKFSCTFCGTNFYQKLLDEGHAKMETNGKVTLLLDKEYETKKLSVEVNYISNNNSTTWISAKYKNGDTINADGSVVRSGVLGPATLTVNEANLTIKNNNKIIYSDNELDDLTLESKETMYRYRDKLYRKYKEDKDYTDYINFEPLGYIKDANDFKKFCSYKVDNQNENLKKIENIKMDNKKVDQVKKENTKVIEDVIKLEGNNKNIQDEKVNNSERLKVNEEKNNYNFLYLFLIIPLLLLIKIILVLSKLYKRHKKSDNL